MENEKKKAANRMTGASLRMAANLLESSLTRPLLISSAFKRLNLPLLASRAVPPEVGMYIPRHLIRAAGEDRGES